MLMKENNYSSIKKSCIMTLFTYVYKYIFQQKNDISNKILAAYNLKIHQQITTKLLYNANEYTT